SLYSHRGHPALPSFPTRRSSDLRRMPLAKFVAYTTLGSLAWNSLFVVAGYLLGEQWDAAVEVADYVQYAVIAAILACVVAAFFRSEEHTSELQSRENLVCRLLLE